MIKFIYKDGAQEVTKEFAKYSEMLRFVALNRIKDEDFVSLQFIENGEVAEEISGIEGLVTKALTMADSMDAFDEAMEAAAMAEDFDEEDREFED